MAPSMLFHQAQRDSFTTSSETHCPCCYRIMRERKFSHHQHPDSCEMISNQFVLTPPPSTLHQYRNIETPEVQNSFGNFEISKKACTKLLHFIASKQASIAKRSSVDYPTHQRTSRNELQTSICDNNELTFLSRKPTRVCNEYSVLGQQTGQSYCNQSVGEMILLAKVLETVEECPWYWGEVSNAEAKAILHGKPVGSFILRDSSDSRYLFSMSVMTSRGPTSIRIVYSNGIFRFDSDENFSRNAGLNSSSGNETTGIPVYRQCVAHMILHYTNHLQSIEAKNHKQNTDDSCPNSQSLAGASSSDACRTRSTDASSDKDSQGHFMCSWMGQNGKRVMSIALIEPQPRRFLSLQQLSRFALNKHLKLWKNTKKIHQLPLPPTLKKYLKKYPYPI